MEYRKILYLLRLAFQNIKGSDDAKRSAIIADIFLSVPKKIASGARAASIEKDIVARAEQHGFEEDIRMMMVVAGLNYKL